MNVNRLFEIPNNQLENNPLDVCLAGKENGKWRKYSTNEYVETANNIAYGLINLGIQKNDKVAIISNNRPEWNIIEQGIQRAGAISVPMYPTISDKDFAYIFNDAEVKIVFTADAEITDKAKNASTIAPTVTGIYSFNKIDNFKNWIEVVELGKSNPQKEEAENRQEQIKKEDLATIIYTSGTTGNPKGVMLSHNNLISNVQASIPLCPVKTGDAVLSFLPLCHVYERMITYLYQIQGASIYYAESMDTIGDNLKEVKPVMFSTVPRLLEKVYDKIVAKGAELTGIKKGLFFWALNLGLRFEFDGKNGFWYEFQLKLANKIIFNKWREALGGNIKAITSGSAPLQPRLARVFWAAQIPILEGYGLTETSPVVSVNGLKQGDKKIGSVGVLIKDVQVKIAEDGEILCKGPNIMMGYYKKPDKTAEVIDSEGWFHTGDIGIMEEGKFLKITDRKKEMFKTSGGKYVAPQLLENKYKESPFIEQVMVVGAGQKFPGALIVPNFDFMLRWAKIKGVEQLEPAEFIKLPVVKDRIQQEIDTFNKDFGKTEQVKRFVLLDKLWGIETGELTPTLKLKRKIISDKFSSEIEEIYNC